MLFHSPPFLLIFLPMALAGYYGLASHARLRLVFLLSASLAFYGYWDLRFVPLLTSSIFINWAIAAIGRRHGYRFLVPAGIAVNLLLLGIFKYFDFFAAALAWLFGGQPQPLNLILPLGISFFTFKQIGYLVDLRRGRAQGYGLLDYATYVSFFPHLIAGPIARHDELIPQLREAPVRPGLESRIGRGVVLLIFGLIKKVVIADSLVVIADPLFAGASIHGLGFVAGWVAALAFGFQIYFDFSGYSDMAIGMALMFGIMLPTNFDAPYRAASIREFWRRWHMTLSRFLRDYLYVPLGGSRRGALNQAIAAMVTMVLGGLWHGAGWNFIAWGGLHGVALAVNHAWSRAGFSLPAVVGWLATFFVVFVGWVLFRAPDIQTASSVLSGMFGIGGGSPEMEMPGELWWIALAAGVALVGPTSQQVALEAVRPRPVAAFAAGLVLVAVLLKVGGGANNDFIYFQF
ncbi:MAG: MBOAT family protein [Rhodospirillaceae bacterium]|nr:MBOAT family protein [Rhodospirillaceae bacterium]